MTLAARLSVDTDPDAVTFTLAVENTGGSPVDVEFRNAKHADVAVLADGDEVWRWSDGQLFAQMIQPVTLDPGQTETYEFEWSDPEPGDYEAVATLNTPDGPSASQHFSV